MFGLRSSVAFTFAFALVYPTCASSQEELWPLSGSEGGVPFCNYGGWRTPRFFPHLSADIGACIGHQHHQCYRDSHILQRNALNYTLWASLMVDATAAYPSGALHGTRYHLGNFDGCMAAATKSPVGAKYCLARVTYHNEHLRTSHEDFEQKRWIDWSDLEPDTDVRHMLQGLGQWPQEVSTKDIWIAVCVPESCGSGEVQRTMEQELKSWHPNLAAVDVPADMCTEGRSSVSVGLIVYSLVIAGLVGIAVVATVWEYTSFSPSVRMKWVMHWSVPKRLNGLVAPDPNIRGVPLQSLAGVRVITLVLLTTAHHGMHVPRAPLLNNFVTRKTLMDPLEALATQAYIFVYTMMFLSGLFLALGSKDSFMRTLILRYLRLTPSYLAVVAFYAMAFPSMGSGPLWKSMINPEAEACINLWWTNALYVNNYVRPSAGHGCVLQSWSLAADMQLCILGTLLLAVYKRWRRISIGVLIGAIAVTMWIPFVTTLLGEREAVWRFTPNVLEDIWAWPLWDRYVSTEQWAMPYFVGLGTGLFLEQAVRDKLSISIHTKRVVVPGAAAMMMLLITSGIFWNYPDVQQSSLLAALYATTVPSAMSICLTIICVALALGPPTWIDSFLRLPIFTTLSRLGYSIYLIHFSAQIAHMALARSPRYVTVVGVIISAIQELILITPLCVLVYLLIDSPIRELSKDLFKPRRKRPQIEIRLQHPTPQENQQIDISVDRKLPDPNASLAIQNSVFV